MERQRAAIGELRKVSRDALAVWAGGLVFCLCFWAGLGYLASVVL
jgi:hypothetical protein